MKITKEEFMAYEEVRVSGITNMFDVSRVIQLANELADVTLTKEMILEIMRDYSPLKEKYLGEEKEEEKEEMTSEEMQEKADFERKALHEGGENYEKKI